MADLELTMDAEDSAESMLDALMELGFNPVDHPDLIKNMHRAFNEEAARTGISLDEPVSTCFVFTEDGSVTVKIERKS